MQQFSVIKNLINRKEFNLSDRHVTFIHQNFKELSTTRRNTVFSQRKDERQQKHYNETQPSFKPENQFAKRRQTSKEKPNQGVLRSQ